MRTLRPAIALNPMGFGRRSTPLAGEVAETAPALSDDVKLFATTFAAGFLFVSMLIV